MHIEPERPLSVVEVNRVCYSEQCQGLKRPHKLVLYVDMEYYTCLVCGRKSEVSHGAAEETYQAVGQLGLSKKEVERIRRNLMAVVGEMQTRKWSKGFTELVSKSRANTSTSILHFCLCYRGYLERREHKIVKK